jgi:hypothetical protein
VGDASGLDAHSGMESLGKHRPPHISLFSMWERTNFNLPYCRFSKLESTSDPPAHRSNAAVCPPPCGLFPPPGAYSSRGQRSVSAGNPPGSKSQECAQSVHPSMTHPSPIPPAFLRLIFAIYVSRINELYSYDTVLIGT